MPCFSQRMLCCLIMLAGGCYVGFSGETCHADEFSEALETLAAAEVGAKPQTELRQAWRAVTTAGTVEQLPVVLAAMKDVGPLANNWLRSAADTIAEREFSATKTLSSEMLETFVLDRQQPSHGREVAYQWLVKIDATTPERLLSGMLDDPSLELRYDAVARLLVEAKASDDEKTQLEKYKRALQSARDSNQLKKCASALKKLGVEPNMAEQLGFISKWQVVGPFDNTDRAGFDKVFPPEQSVELTSEYSGKAGPVKWIEAVAEQKSFDELGNVDLNAALVEEKSVLAYAFATFVVAREQNVEFRYESKEATKLWINGKELAANNIYHSGSGFDQYVVMGKLKAGPNQILIKVCQNEQTEPWTRPWDFRLRITDSLGEPIRSTK